MADSHLLYPVAPEVGSGDMLRLAPISYIDVEAETVPSFGERCLMVLTVQMRGTNLIRHHWISRELARHI